MRRTIAPLVEPASRRRTTCWGAHLLALAVLPLTLLVSPGAAQAPMGGGVVIDGDIGDVVALALTERCGFVIEDLFADACFTKPGLSGCSPNEECVNSLLLYVPNYGGDVDTVAVAYDRANDVLYAGIRMHGFVGDFDGGGTWDSDCQSDIEDQPGVGGDEFYRLEIDTNCDGLANITIELRNNTVTPTTGLVDAFFEDGSPVWEFAYEGLDLPPIFCVQARAGSIADLVAEDVTEEPCCPPPPVNLTVNCDGPGGLCVGDTGNYTIQVTNPNLFDVTTVNLTTVLPAGITFVAFVDDADWSGGCSHVAGTITCADATLEAGATNTAVFTVRNDGCTNGTFQATATAELTQEGCITKPIPGIGDSNCPVSCLGAPVLDCAITSEPGDICAGQEATCAGVVHNTGTAEATNVVVRRGDGGPIVQDCGSIAAGDSCAFSDTFTPDCSTPGPVNVDYVVSYEGKCLDTPGETRCTCGFNCVGAPVVSCELRDEPGDVCPGVETTCSGVVLNTGNEEATNVVVHLGATDGPIIQDCGTIAAGDSCLFSDPFTPSCTTAEDQSRVYVVTYEGDCLKGPQQSSCTCNYRCTPPEVSIEKTTDPQDVGDVGNTSSVTIVVTNDGESDLNPVRVSDIVPVELGFDPTSVTTDCDAVTASTGPADDPGYFKITFTDFMLAAGASCTISYDFACDAAGAHIDTAKVFTWCDGTEGLVDSTAASDTALVRCAQPGDACPRTPGFWAQQACYGCVQEEEGGRVKFGCTDMQAITDCIDDTSEFLDWSALGDSARVFRMCDLVDPSREHGPTRPCRQAIRQWTAFLANFCVGELGIEAGNGDIVSLPGSTLLGPACQAAFGVDTVGELIPVIDDELIDLLDDPRMTDGCDTWPLDEDLKERFTDIIACLDLINNGHPDGILGGIDEEACVADGNSVEDAFRDKGLLALTEEWLLIHGGAGGSTSVADVNTNTDMNTISEIELLRPIPNPFTHTVKLAYEVPAGAALPVQVAVYNTAGRRISTLVDQTQGPGRYQTVWNGRDGTGEHVASGIYFYRVVIGHETAVRRVTYLR